MTRIVLNGEGVELPADACVADVLQVLRFGPAGVAIAVNDEIVPRTAWDDTLVAEGDRVEVLAAAQGG
ncbi:MAG: sulfur carrier protein ThiS [Acidimicrobiales bacterium]